MRPLTAKTKKSLKDKCFICGKTGVEQHHSLIWRNRQISEPYAIIPLCVYHHRGNLGVIWQDVREKCEMESIKNGLEHLEQFYPKNNWRQRLIFLTKKYATKQGVHSLE